MSDTATSRVQTERRVRKVPAIVLDRPPFRPCSCKDSPIFSNLAAIAMQRNGKNAFAVALDQVASTGQTPGMGVRQYRQRPSRMLKAGMRYPCRSTSSRRQLWQ